MGNAACSEDTTPAADMGTLADSSTSADAATTSDSATEADAATTADGATETDGATESDSAVGSDATTADAAAAALWGDVHTELRGNCTPCHSTGSSGGHNMAQTSASDAYTDSQLSAVNVACTGLTKGACAAIRVRAGTMPPGGISNTTERARIADILDSWVAGGQLAP